MSCHIGISQQEHCLWGSNNLVIQWMAVFEQNGNQTNRYNSKLLRCMYICWLLIFELVTDRGKLYGGTWWETESEREKENVVAHGGEKLKFVQNNTSLHTKSNTVKCWQWNFDTYKCLKFWRRYANTVSKILNTTIQVIHVFTDSMCSLRYALRSSDAKNCEGVQFTQGNPCNSMKVALSLWKYSWSDSDSCPNNHNVVLSSTSYSWKLVFQST